MVLVGGGEAYQDIDLVSADLRLHLKAFKRDDRDFFQDRFQCSSRSLLELFH
jgi:hypothetical protein